MQLNLKSAFPHLVLIGSVLLFSADSLAQEIPPANIQISGALSPAPANLKDGARVFGFDESGVMVELRKGTNEFTCLADKPGDDRFHASCYHNSLEPFMARGRALRSEGKGRDESRDIRKMEIEAGTLPMPTHPTALYQLFGAKDALNMESGEVSNTNPLYVMYIPYATTETTGLSTEPLREGSPWLMDAGLPWAHIMYTPANP